MVHDTRDGSSESTSDDGLIGHSEFKSTIFLISWYALWESSYVGHQTDGSRMID